MTLAAEQLFPNEEEEREFLEATPASRRLVPPRELDQVYGFYRVDGPHYLQVMAFLTRHSHLVGILLDARPHIKSVFGEMEAYLQVEDDPDGGFEELFCVIMVDASPEKALALLRRFDELWFSEAARRTGNLLTVTVDTDQVEPV